MPTRFPLRHLWIIALLGMLCALAAPERAASAAEQSARQPQATATHTPTHTPTPTRTRTPTPTATYTPTRSGPFVALPGGPILFDFPTPRPVAGQGRISGQTLTALERSALAVVKLMGCPQAAATVCNYSEGSGILIHPRGLILTALHVVVENPGAVSPWVYEALGFVLLRQEKWQEAAAAYTQAVQSAYSDESVGHLLCPLAGLLASLQEDDPELLQKCVEWGTDEAQRAWAKERLQALNP